MLWAYLDFTRLTLDFSDAESEVLPRAVYDEKANTIVQLCDAGVKTGITPGMGLAQAAALCPDLTISVYSEEKERGHLHSLAARLYQVASDIVLMPPAALAVRLDNLCQYYGSVSGAWNAITSELSPISVDYSYATGWSVECARVLANAASNQIFTDKKAISDTLRRCQLTHLELDDKAMTTLNRVGVVNLARLLALPVSELGKRFSNQIIRYLTALRGDTFPTYPLYRPDDVFERDCDVAYEIENTQHLVPYFTKMLEDLAVFLRLRNKVVCEIRLSLFYREQHATVLTIRSAVGISQVSKWLEIGVLQLDKLTLSAPVIGLRLTADNLSEHDTDNQDFFQDRHQYFAQKQLISQLQARLGNHSVVTPATGNDHRMEQQTQHGKRMFPTRNGHWLPAIRLASPEPLTSPCNITFGPVRLQTGWWDDEAVKRDYFIARTANGKFVQIFRNAQQQWFVQGYYA